MSLRAVATFTITMSALLVGVVCVAPASAQTDPLGCEATIFDPGEALDDAQIEDDRAETARRLSADVRVRAELAVDADLERRLGQLRNQCEGWANGSELADDLVVVMFSPTEREASVYFGADSGPELESRWEPAVDAMIDDFRRGEFTAGVEDALAQLRRDPVSSSRFSEEDDDSGDSNKGSGEVVFWIVVLVSIYGVGMVYKQIKGGDDDGTGWTSGGSSYSRRRSSSSRRRSFSGSRRSSSRSRSSGSRRAGGGSKRW